MNLVAFGVTKFFVFLFSFTASNNIYITKLEVLLWIFFCFFLLFLTSSTSLTRFYIFVSLCTHSFGLMILICVERLCQFSSKILNLYKKNVSCECICHLFFYFSKPRQNL